MLRRTLSLTAVSLLLVRILLGGSHTALAKERVFRLFDQRDGLPVGEVVQLVQDRDGFIWIGTFAGLVRYDGDELRQWAPEQLRGHVNTLAAGPGGEVLVRIDSGSQATIEQTGLYQVVPDGIQAVVGPDGSPLRQVLDAAFGTDGLLCIARGADALCRAASGAWVRHLFQDERSEQAQRIRRGPHNSVLAITDGGLWRIEAAGTKRKLVSLPSIINAVVHPDGSLFIQTSESDGKARILKFDGVRLDVILDIAARGIGLTVRGDVVWASFGRYLAVIRPGEVAEILGPAEGLPAGGPLLTDREGSLWFGTFRGLIHMPEPETVVWTEDDGLPSIHTRFLERVGDTIWVGTWQGLGRLAHRDGRWRASPGTVSGVDRMCVDGTGGLWIASLGRGLVRHEPGHQRVFPDPEAENWLGCSRRADGGLWLTNRQGIFVTPPAGGPPRRLAANPPDPSPSVFFRQILEDGAGRLWIAANDQICHASLSSVRSGADVGWDCQHIPSSRGISSIVELTDGHLWLATDRAGVWRFEAGRWVQMRGSLSLPSFSLRGLVAAAGGGVWILGHGTVVRVREAHDAPLGWQPVEQLTGLHGLPSAAAEDLLEAPDGSVWVTTTVGLVHVPARARKTTLPPPGVQLVDVMVDGERITPAISPLRIRSDDVLELRFAALAYRDRGRLRHQYRLQPGARWNTSQGGPSVFQFPDLGPGTYAVEVRASLDGATWSPVTSSLALEILPPWYRRAWAHMIFASAALMLLYLAYRLRVAFLLRLERQRTRIAMDLHDEIGSGLGSIHILAGLAAERTPPGAPQAGLVSTISETAAELGASLGEIVWSLRARSGTLEALISHLAERAAKLYPAGSPALILAIPETLPPTDLPLSVRWNVALIAIEALHNAARHAGATTVVLGLEREGLRWKLWIEDDGHGPGATPASSGSGLGIESMKRRAGEIGADLTLSSSPAGGFRVALVFDPRVGGVV